MSFVNTQPELYGAKIEKIEFQASFIKHKLKYRIHSFLIPLLLAYINGVILDSVTKSPYGLLISMIAAVILDRSSYFVIYLWECLNKQKLTIDDGYMVLYKYRCTGISITIATVLMFVGCIILFFLC